MNNFDFDASYKSASFMTGAKKQSGNRVPPIWALNVNFGAKMFGLWTLYQVKLESEGRRRDGREAAGADPERVGLEEVVSRVQEDPETGQMGLSKSWDRWKLN